MNLLAFDTSSLSCSVALLTQGEQIYVVDKMAPRQQSNLILPMIQSLLNQASLTLKDMDAIAYGCGPGSFTGIRIAASVAQGIGFAANIPIVQISSLAAMAQTAYLERKWSRLCTAVDAHQNQIYWALYEVNQFGLVELIGREKVYNPEEISLEKQYQDYLLGIQMKENIVYSNCYSKNAEQQSLPIYAIGNAWEKYEDKMNKALSVQPHVICSKELPSAKAIVILAREKFEQQHWVQAAQAIPSYLR